MYENFSILMKEGHENEAPTIDNIRGIVVPLITGKQFLLLPKYEFRKLLDQSATEEQLIYWKTQDEWDALYDEGLIDKTDVLARAGSPAALYVRKYGMDLPNLQMLAAIMQNRRKINEVASEIKGADEINSGSYYWPCCRYGTDVAWIANGNLGFFSNSYFCSTYLAAPVALLP